MPKKKHRKKVGSAKHGVRRKAAKRTAQHHGVSPSKHKKRHGLHARPEHHSASLLRAIKRRRAAQNGEHLDFEGARGTAHHTHKKRGKGGFSHKGGSNHVEPIVTEKSFENMLAYRRFQNHAR